MPEKTTPAAPAPNTTTRDENGMLVRFMCPCLGPLEEKLKANKGKNAYLNLCSWADFGENGDKMTQIRGFDPVKFYYEVKYEVTDPKKPAAKPKTRKKWKTGHFSLNFCPLCGASLK